MRDDRITSGSSNISVCVYMGINVSLSSIFQFAKVSVLTYSCKCGSAYLITYGILSDKFCYSFIITLCHSKSSTFMPLSSYVYHALPFSGWLSCTSRVLLLRSAACMCRQISIIWDQIYDDLDLMIFRMVVSFWIFLHYTSVSTVEWPL